MVMEGVCPGWTWPAVGNAAIQLSQHSFEIRAPSQPLLHVLAADPFAFTESIYMYSYVFLLSLVYKAQPFTVVALLLMSHMSCYDRCH